MDKWRSKICLLSTFLCVAVLLTARQGRAQIIAYDAPLQPGNQAWTGNLGLDFDVNSPIRITSLGAFDNNGDGFTGTVTVGIFDRSTTAQVGVSTLVSGTAG